MVQEESFDGRSSLLFITHKPRVERYTKSMSLEYEPASESLYISGIPMAAVDRYPSRGE